MHPDDSALGPVRASAFLQAELSRAQEALRVARSEGARRLRELQQLQEQQVPLTGGPGLAQQLEAEAVAREAAEGKLRDARASLARHKQLIQELRSKVKPIMPRDICFLAVGWLAGKESF